MMIDLLPKLMHGYLFFSASQRWSAERIGDYQDLKLRTLVRHAAKQVPYYRQLFKEIGFDPAAFRGREDMHRIPLLDKEMVRTRAQELIAGNARRFGIIWESTSGSTGTPLHIIVDRGARAGKLATLVRAYQWGGYRFWMKTFSLQSYYLKNGFYETKPLFRVLRYDSNQFKRETAIEVIKLLQREEPQFFMGFPFDLLVFSRFAAEADLKIPSPKAMVVYGETLSDQKRASLEKAYNCEVYNYYSQHECASMIAECEEHSLHLVDDFAYHEFVHTDGSDASKAGRGELVGTNLYNYAMPLIRYRTRDDVTFDPEQKPCACGRRFTTVSEIVGKQCDYIETPDGRYLGAVMSHSIDNGQGVVVSQCVQDTIDHLTVNLVVDGSFTKASETALERDLRKRLGQEMQIDFRIVPQLEKRPGGKTPFILSKIGHKYA
ncbi:hypothetical protein KJ564_12780 [bacterium]|nr:hypothetical protein [bacterium]MBU1881013.1 hypothetical protein [bacterium]